MPENSGDSYRTSDVVHDKVESIEIEHNVNSVFSGSEREINLTIGDIAGIKDAINGFTIMLDMANTEWKGESEAGYTASARMDEIRVIIEFNTITDSTAMRNNSNDQLTVSASGTDMDPLTLWN